MDFCLWRLNGQWSIVPLGTTEYRQAVECIARNPCIHDHNDIKSAEGTTEGCFCRTFGALIFLQSYFAGIPHCVLHHLPIFCRPYRTFLLRAASFELRASLLTAHGSQLIAYYFLIKRCTASPFSVLTFTK